MTVTKEFLLLLGIAVFVLVSQPFPAAAISLEEAEVKTEHLLDRIAKKQLDGLADQMQNDAFFAGVAPGLWGQLISGISQVFNVVGNNAPVFGFEKLGQKRLGTSLVSNRYAILIDPQPLLFDVWLYKPHDDWQFLNINFVFGTNAEEVLKVWFESAE